jgi:hypothetical protein
MHVCVHPSSASSHTVLDQAAPPGGAANVRQGALVMSQGHVICSTIHLHMRESLSRCAELAHVLHQQVQHVRSGTVSHHRYSCVSPANVVGKEHWYSDKLTVRGMVPWRHTMIRIPAGAKCEWWWARATTLIKTLCQKETTVGAGPNHGQAVHTPPFLNPPPVHWW